MQVYGLVGQTEEGIWPEAQLIYIIYVNKCLSGDKLIASQEKLLCKA